MKTKIDEIYEQLGFGVDADSEDHYVHGQNCQTDHDLYLFCHKNNLKKRYEFWLKYTDKTSSYYNEHAVSPHYSTSSLSHWSKYHYDFDKSTAKICDTPPSGATVAIARLDGDLTKIVKELSRKLLENENNNTLIDAAKRANSEHVISRDTLAQRVEALKSAGFALSNYQADLVRELQAGCVCLSAWGLNLQLYSCSCSIKITHETRSIFNNTANLIKLAGFLRVLKNEEEEEEEEEEEV